MSWDDLKTVLAVLRAGSFLNGARALGVSHSTASRRITALEAMLGVKLLERTPEGLVPTAAAEQIRDVAERTEADVLDLQRAIAGGDTRLSGTVRVAVPYLFAVYMLMPMFQEFRQRYPDIQLEIIAGYAHTDLTRREADVAVRVTDSPPESAVGRRIATLDVALYGPASAPHRPKHPLPYVALDDGSPIPRWYVERYPNATLGPRVNDYPLALEAVRAGLGATALPTCVADQQSGLRRIIHLPDLRVGLWLLTHADLRKTARVRAVLDALAQALPARLGKRTARSSRSRRA
ncbi:MAG: LysR family transcriptional regulator [Deltaproteobacteria bacterium]|nr:LysR family transcriptional regulator [Deltaproteobacteria bacterium]